MFSEADLKPAFRLSKDSIIVLIQMLLWQKPHGWSHESELSVSAGWHEAPHAEWQQTSSSCREPQLAEQSSVLVEEMVAILHKFYFISPQARRDGGGGCRLCSSVWRWGILLCGWCNGSCSHMLKHCNTSSILHSRGVCEHDWLASYACRRLWSFSTRKALKHVFSSPSIFVKLTIFKTKLISN